MGHDVTDFPSQVLERSRSVPVVTDFWAAWCGPCRVLGPVLERMAASANGRWELAKVDTEALPEVAARYGIASIPNVKLFVDGEVVDEFVGVLPERAIQQWLDRAIPSPAAGDVASARAAIAAGDFEPAAVALRPIVEAEPANADARLALGETLLHLNPAAVRAVVAPLEDDPDRADRASALHALADALLAAADPAALPAGPERDRFAAGAEALRRGDWDGAVESFIEVMRMSRDWAGGLAKASARAAFIRLGFDHPVVDRHHRAFSSALHV